MAVTIEKPVDNQLVKEKERRQKRASLKARMETIVANSNDEHIKSVAGSILFLLDDS